MFSLWQWEHLKVMVIIRCDHTIPNLISSLPALVVLLLVMCVALSQSQNTQPKNQAKESEFKRLLPDLEQADQQQQQRRKAQVVRRRISTAAATGRWRALRQRSARPLSDITALLSALRLARIPDLAFQGRTQGCHLSRHSSVRELWEAVLPVPQWVREKILTAAGEVFKQRRKRIGSLEEFREA